MDVQKFKQQYPHVVQDAKTAYATWGQNLSKVKRELSKKYRDPTDKDETKAEIMSYINGSLREILGLNVDIIEQLLHASNCDLVAKYRESLGLPPDPNFPKFPNSEAQTSNNTSTPNTSSDFHHKRKYKMNPRRSQRSNKCNKNLSDLIRSKQQHICTCVGCDTHNKCYYK